MLRNSLAFTTSPTFSSLPTLSCISPLTNSSPHWTDNRTFPHSCPMPHSLRRNSTPIIDALLCFTFLISDPSCSSTSPSVRWFPFDLVCFPILVPHSLCSTGSSFRFSFHLSLLQSLVDTLSYDFSFFFYISFFPFHLGPCAPLYSI